MASARDNIADFPAWANQDRDIFLQTFNNTDDIFDASHVRLKKSTVDGYRYAYVRYLNTLDPSLRALPPLRRMTPQLIERYYNTYAANTKFSSRYALFARLSRTMKAMYPQEDWGWLQKIVKRIKARAVPAQHQIVCASDIYLTAFALIEGALTALASGGPIKARNLIALRDGLLMGLLIEVPIRVSNLASLEIGKQLLRDETGWKISIPGSLVKNHIDLEYGASLRLSRYLDTYTSCYRGRFEGAHLHCYLWPGRAGHLGVTAIRHQLKARLKEGLGVDISPHEFRNVVATFLSVEDPTNAFMARDLLGHSSFQTTDRYYISRGNSRQSSRQYSEVLKQKFAAANLKQIWPPDDY